MTDHIPAELPQRKNDTSEETVSTDEAIERGIRGLAKDLAELKRRTAVNPEILSRTITI